MLSIAFFAAPLSAQSINTSLKKFVQTDFMTKYQELQKESYVLVRDFRRQEYQYDQNDIERVRQSYDNMAKKFNFVLLRIKADFLDKEQMKLIAGSPDLYASKMELEMGKLESRYFQTFNQTILDVTESDVDGSALLALLPQLIPLVSDLVKQVSAMRKAAKKYTADMLQKRLVEPYRFRLWSEIKVAGSEENNNSDLNDYDPFNNSGGGFDDDLNTDFDDNNDPFNTDTDDVFNGNDDPFGDDLDNFPGGGN